MEYTIIEVPDMNDSISRIVLLGVAYYIRFTYNDEGDYWRVGIYDAQMNPIVIGMKIVPNYPLNLFYGTSALPRGMFMATSTNLRIGRDDFLNGAAQFVFVPAP